MNASCSFVSSTVAVLAAPLLLGAIVLTIGAFLVPKRSRRLAGGILLFLATLQALAYAAAVLVFSRVDLQVDGDRITWQFGMGALRESVARGDLKSISAKVRIPHGLGLRIEDGYIAYWLGGTSGVRMRFARGTDIEVSCTNPSAVLRALQSN